MFDIGFWELATIGVIALLVIGPERLPRLARTAGRWFGKARSFVLSVKADIEQEVKAEELKEIMKKQADSSGVHEIVEETRSTAEQLKEPVAEDKPKSRDDAPEQGEQRRDTAQDAARSDTGNDR